MRKILLPFCLLSGIVFTLSALDGSYRPDYLSVTTSQGSLVDSTKATLTLTDNRTKKSAPILPVAPIDTLPPIKERFGDFITDPKRNPFDLKDPKSIEKSVEYDPITDRYIVTERIGGELFRPPTYLSFQEYQNYRRKEDESNYFKQLAGIGQKKDKNFSLDPLSKVDIKKDLIDRLFGGNTVSIQPRGNVDLTFGSTYQRLDNPILPRRAQRQFIPVDFNMNINMNVQGKIGEKLNLNTNFNTGATFDFDNQIKLNYNSSQFGEDDIIKKIEAGNVSLPLRGTLIQGGQSLFGLKTELQFGHLRLTAIASQQRSQRQNIQIQGGSQVQTFEVRADQYDENRHFFLSHFNRQTFEPALQNLPQVRSLFKIENIEVWLTNDRNEVENVRDIVALADLGEGTNSLLVNPQVVRAFPGAAPQDIDHKFTLPSNESNDLYARLTSSPDTRRIERAVSVLQSEGLRQTRDFEKVSARRLKPSEFSVNAELGFVSLNVNVLPDQVIGVAYTYSYNGRTYKVGELSNNSEITQTAKNISNPNNPQPRVDTTLNVLYVKMLKSTTQRTDVPTWKLMMKNIYSIGAFQVNPADFRLDIYYDDPGKGYKRFLPESNLSGVPLLRVFNADVLNTQGDPQPDGIFDFVPGLTINTRNGRVMLPVLEPFGSSLGRKIDNKIFRDKYTYQQLYDSTLFIAQEFQEKNRFVIKGTYKSSVSAEISLGAFNIPRGSVRVSAGGQTLLEGRDFEIDYNIGRVRILNDAILASGVPVNVSFEDNTLFGFQQKSLFGLRADYQIDKNFNIGATMMRLFERPFTQKVNIGDDPINNSIYGVDMNINKPAPWITKLVDAIPGISTKANSSINFTGEAAMLRPGHSRAINQNRADKGGVVYIDDFEGTSNSFDLRQPVANWYLASVPQNQTDVGLFPESKLVDSLDYGVNRAKLSWYRIDQTVRSAGDSKNPYTSFVPQIEVFPNVQLQPQDLPNIPTFDLSYNPLARGPYNFDKPQGTAFSAGVRAEGDSLRLLKPEERWGGIMRALTTNDFQAANIEFLEFWMLSPFLDPNDPTKPVDNWQDKQGTMYVNLGNVSEDILRDGRKFFENGLKSTFNPNRRTTLTNWSKIPNGQQIVNAFDNDTTSRRQQDVGLDGLNDVEEASHFANYLGKIKAVNANVAAAIAKDPSGDNFRFFTDPSFPADASLIRRYRDYNNPEGNSRTNSSRNALSAATNLPDAEDLNFDNTMNESESYFQYKINIRANPSNPREIAGGTAEYITDKLEDPNSHRIWYRFRIPLKNNPNATNVGGIRDFRSIRFIRMFLKGYRAPVTMRFARLELVRNQWRRYTQTSYSKPADSLNCARDFGSPTTIDVDAVNVEENSKRSPFNYVLPLGIQRERALGVFNTLQNEQSLTLNIANLCNGDSRSVFKNINLDLRVYERFKMFVHAETKDPAIKEGNMSVFVRLGSDFKNNYYEYEIPLVMSDTTRLPANKVLDEYKKEVWRPENEFDFPLDLLRKVKIKRDSLGFSRVDEYIQKVVSDVDPTLIRYVKVRGNPNLGLAKIAMIGVRNVNVPTRASKVIVWVNEMRLTGLDERGGVAALGRMDIQLADFGTLTVSGNYSSIGFGAIDKKVAQRSRQDVSGYDFAANLELGKFLPSKLKLRVPFYAQYSRIIKSPEYDPYDLDIKFKEKVKNTQDPNARDSIKTNAQDVTTIRTMTFANVRKERSGSSKPTPLDISNFAFSYSVTEQSRRDPIIESDNNRRTNGGVNYGFSNPTKYIEPFKGLKGKWLKPISDLNINLIPSSITFSTLLDRTFQQTRYRFTGLEERFSTFYNKRFTWDRNYNVQWDITKSIKINFTANNFAVIDEPNEFKVASNPEIKDVAKYRRDSIWSNIKRLGRTKNYKHEFTVNYTLPTKSIPILEWIQARGQYRGSYAWTAAALNTDSLGNTIQNSQGIQGNVDFNFDQIYTKIPYLRQIDLGAPTNARPTAADKKKKAPPIPGQDDQKPTKKEKSKDDEEARLPSLAERILIRPFLLLRKARFNYTEQKTTVLPGYTPTSSILGMANFNSPGWGFVSGFQPRIGQLKESEYYSERDWLYQSAAKGWISKSVFLNREVQQNISRNYDGRVTIEPIKDFRIDIDFNRNYTENHSEYFKDTVLDYTSNFVHAVPKKFGQLSMSFGALPTLFQGSGTQEVDGIKAIFSQFEKNRAIISHRLAQEVRTDTAYSEGYGRTQQQVLVPAFLAAYTGKDAKTFTLDIFKLLPKANWRLSYNGLAKLPLFAGLFQSFTLTHGYKSTLTVNSFITGLDFLRTRSVGGINPLNGNFYPRLEIPDITINESFNPLVAIAATLKSGMNFNFEYKSSRNLQMSFVSNQLAETRTKEILIGYGHNIPDFNFPFAKAKKSKAKKAPKKPLPSILGGNNGQNTSQAQPHNLRLQFNFSLRDDVTFNHLLDQNVIEPTRGNFALSISPSAEYKVNQRLSLRLFTDYRRNRPRTSAGFPRTEVNGGLVVRFQLN